MNAGRGNPAQGQRPPAERRERADFGDEIPRNVDPLRTNLHNVRHDTRRPRQDGSGQPDKQGLAGALLPAAYDPKTGAYVTADGSVHRQLTITPATGKGGTSWETLMLEPVR